MIGAVSIAMSLIGLELGNRLGPRTGQRGELLGGLVLIGVGICIARRRALTQVRNNGQCPDDSVANGALVGTPYGAARSVGGAGRSSLP